LSVTIKDIAREANVSYATVSRAFTNAYGVRPATRQKVLEIARRLNYSPNGIARGLVLKKTKTIGLIIPDITNPFFPEVARGIEEGAKEEGYSVFLCNTNWEQDRESQYVRLLAEKRVDGLIIASVSDAPDPLLEMLFESIPVVCVDRPPHSPRWSYVVIDNLRGAVMATSHLIEAGYRSIGFIGAIEQSLPVDERLKGYRMAMEQHGLPVEERYIRIGNFRQESGEAIIQDMIRNGDHPRAVFAENDVVALGVIQGIREAGLSVPGDIAVVGFDDIPIASYRYIQLTTVLQPKYDMGRAAAGILFEEIRGRSAADGGNGGVGPDVKRRPRSGSATGFDAATGMPGRKVLILEPRLIVRKTSVAT
jgi:LacI family transcriptional regulator